MIETRCEVRSLARRCVTREPSVRVPLLGVGMACAAVLILAWPAASPAADVGTNVNVSNQGGPQSETDIAIDPTNPQHIVGGSNDISGTQMRVYESFNGGAGWTNVPLPPAPSPFNFFASDPSVAFDAAGNAFYSYLGVNGTGSTTTLVLVGKQAGTSVWSAPVVVPNINADKNLIAVDRTGGTFNGTLYLAWVNNYTSGQDIRLGRSTGGGFVSTRVNDGGGALWAPDPAIGPNGEVYVAWVDYSSTAHNLIIDRSVDGGSTFGTDHIIHHWSAPTGSGLTLPIPAYPQRGVAILPSIDVDRSPGPNRGAAYCVFDDAMAGNGLDIFLRKSMDGGATWTVPRRVNDDPPGVAADQFLPRLAVDESDGSIHIAWYDTRDDPNNRKTQLYYTRSTDGGNTFEPGTKVTTAPSDESLSGNDANGYGDYIGMAVRNGIARPLWTDSRTGSEEIFTAPIRATPLSVPVAAGSGVALDVPVMVRGGRSVDVRYRTDDRTVPVTLDVFSVSGARVRRLNAGMVPAGEHVSTWDLTGHSGERVARGIYFVRLVAGARTLTRKLVVL